MLDEAVVVKRRGWLKDLRGSLGTARYLKGKRYDMVIDFQCILKSSVWVLVSGGKRKVGFSWKREGSHLFLNDLMPPGDPQTHAVERNLALARYAGGYAESAFFPIYVAGTDEQRAEALLKKEGVRGRFFVLSPGARWATKRWGDENFARLARLVSQKTGFAPVFVGSSQERSGIESLSCEEPLEAANLSGMTTLKELASILKRAEFVIAVDSAPMHMAAAVGTPVAALFGPTSAQRTGPYGSGHTVIRKDIPCGPCFKKTCGDIRCMKEITVEEALGAVTAIMGEAVGRV
jgi:lipopolysaccharide heptosyltransferase II